MRVNMSEMGSLMLMYISSLPAGLAQTRYVTAHRGFAQFVSPQPELPVKAARPARNCAPVPLSHGTRIPRQLLKAKNRVLLYFETHFGIVYNRFELGPFFGVPSNELATTDFAIEH